MLKKIITYKDYNGVERKEDFYFNLSRAEVLEMEASYVGGFSGMVEKIIAAKDNETIFKVFKDMVLKAYGERTLDGKRFRKVDDNGRPLWVAFSETEAYSNLIMELAKNTAAAVEFVNGVLPGDMISSKDEPVPANLTPVN